MSSTKIKNLVVNAVLSALTIMLAFLPIKTAGLEITLAVIPIAVGAICFGEYSGLLLGAVFGVCSFLQCLGFSPFGAVLLGINPFLTFLVCVPTRMLMGYLAGLIFKVVKYFNQPVAYVVSALSAALFNTVFFMGTLVLCFYNTEYIQGFVGALGAVNPLMFVLLFVGINGAVELVANFVIALPCAKALSVALKRMG